MTLLLADSSTMIQGITGNIRGGKGGRFQAFSRRPPNIRLLSSKPTQVS
jgi:hypothetical protein